jgi:hypothetical protein
MPRARLPHLRNVRGEHKLEVELDVKDESEIMEPESDAKERG